jgi:serine/threonine protein kinase
MMNQDSDKTMVRTRRMPFRAGAQNEVDHGVNVLPIGTHLGEFEILDLIGEGGFGIVYLAYDHSLERHVALKEYMPAGLASRTTKMAVTVRSQHNVATFTAGLRSFINEAKMLAQFDSPALVKVHRFWEGNGTAYMVMPFYEGVTLKQALKEHRVTPTESWIRLLLADLFDAIETIHQVQCFHRDIAPDNILLLKDGRPVLLDFGAARRVIGDLTQCLTVILKPGFAPIEQYADIAGLRQGAWTDIYALAAVVYYIVTGKAPPPAVARMVNDEMVPAREAGKGRYSNGFLAVLDKALAVKPEQRYRSIAELRQALDIMETVPRTLPRASTRWAGTELPTTRLAEPKMDFDQAPSPAPAPKAEAKHRIEPKLDSHPDARADQRPASPAEVRTDPRTDPRPEAHAEARQAAPSGVRQREPDLTTFHTSRPDLPPAQRNHRAFGEAQQPAAKDHALDRNGRSGTRSWILLFLLLVTGVFSGVYLGIQQPWKDRPLANDPGASANASGTSGASGDPESPNTPQREETRIGAAGQRGAQTGAVSTPSGQLAQPNKPVQPSQNTQTAQTSQTPQVEKPRDTSQPADAFKETPREASKAPAYTGPAAAGTGDGAVAGKAPAPRTSPDEQLWQSASTANTPAAYDRYLQRFPKGLYAYAARQRLEAMGTRTAQREAGATQAKGGDSQQPRQAGSQSRPLSADDDAWSIATAIHQPPAYESYLSRFPKGKYTALARDRLAGFKPSVAPAVSAPAVAASPAPGSSSGTSTAGSSGNAGGAEKSGTASAGSAAASNSGNGATPSNVIASAAPVSPGSASQPASPPSAPVPDVAVAPSSSAAKEVPAPRKETREDPARSAVVIPSTPGKKPIFIEDQILTGDFSVDQKTGIVSGSGRIVWTNGNQFDGTLVRGMKEGKGTFRWTSGQRYVGDWAHDLPNGRGTLFFANGNRYDGEVKNGVPDGRGMAKFKNGDAYNGAWAGGKSNGMGRYTWADGSYWEGEFRDDKRTENGKMVFAEKKGEATAESGGGGQLPQARSLGVR